MKRVYAILPLLLLLCFTQNAQAANFYWGGRAVVSSFELEGLTLNLNGALGYNPQSVDLRKSFDAIAVGGAVFLGLDFNRAGDVPLRFEYEASLQSADASIRVDGSFPTSGTLLAVAANVDLEVSTLFSQSLNLRFDVPVGEFPLKPYIGCGLGMTYIFYDADVTINRGVGAIETLKSKTGHKRGYYYSLGGGARMALGKRTFLDLSVRYMEKQDWSIKMQPLGLEFSSRSMDAGIGLQYYF